MQFDDTLILFAVEYNGPCTQGVSTDCVALYDELLYTSMAK
jgi:hypothetical protein